MKNWLCVFGKPGPVPGACVITSSEQSLVVSILSTGTFFSALFAAPIADFLGRRLSITSRPRYPHLRSWCRHTGHCFHSSSLCRIFAGWGVGMVSILVPMYQSECSPKWIRYVSLRNLPQRTWPGHSPTRSKQWCSRHRLSMGDLLRSPRCHHQQCYQGQAH